MSDQLSSDLASLKIDRSAPPRPKGKSPLGAIVGVLVLLGAAGAGYQWGLPALQSAVFKTEVETTEVITMSPAQASVELTSTGYIIAQRDSAVACKVMGKVKAQHVRQWSKVKAGDVLLEIDPADQNASITTAYSQSAAARARIQTAKATLAETQQQARRAARSAQADTRIHRAQGQHRRLEPRRRLRSRSGIADAGDGALDHHARQPVYRRHNGDQCDAALREAVG
jgi:multidrug efflux pump subunit AcrA (membrane-fusion protein)